MRKVIIGLSASLSLLLTLDAGAQPAPAAPPEPAPPTPEPSTSAPAPSPEPAPPPASPAPVPAASPSPAPPVVAPGAGAKTDGLPPPPLAPPPLFPSQLEDVEEEPLVGFSKGRLFLRDADDTFRLYPGGRLRTDFIWAPGGADITSAQGARFLKPSFLVRRVRLELSGEILERIAFTAGAELGGQRIGETVYTGDDTVRFAPANAHDGTFRPADVTISYRFRSWLNLTLGNQNVPFSMSNRTREYATTFMERNIAIRGFVVPYAKDLGLTLWGDLLEEDLLSYEVGVFGGDGPDRPFVDARADFVGRVFARPLSTLGDGTFWDETQVGLSVRHGQRSQDDVFYDAPTIATNHGYVLWQPGYVDSNDRVTKVIPSGAENAIGGEVRVPIRAPTGAVFDLRGEAYYLNKNTREAIAGFETTNTERFGRLNGVSWYTEVSFWGCCTDQLVTGRPGMWRPYTVNPKEDTPLLRGLHLSVLAGGIHANYRGASRSGSTADANTPNGDITVYQLGGGAQFWIGHNFRATLNYFAYFAPGAGQPADNQVLVPQNLVVAGGFRGGGEVQHELGVRTAITF